MNNVHGVLPPHQERSGGKILYITLSEQIGNYVKKQMNKITISLCNIIFSYLLLFICVTEDSLYN